MAFRLSNAYPVMFRDRKVGEFIPDLVAFGVVIVDPKVIDRITDHERGKMINYLRIAKLRIGLILNFKFARLQSERIAL
jgi:GxxExxY protein